MTSSKMCIVITSGEIPLSYVVEVAAAEQPTLGTLHFYFFYGMKWNLIESGTDKKSIKLRGISIR